MLEKEFDFYLKNQQELAKEYNGRFIVIKGETVIGVYDTEINAFTKSKEKHEVGTFLIQKCSLGTEDYTGTFHSRVVFHA